jgi:hypothetical protein
MLEANRRIVRRIVLAGLGVLAAYCVLYHLVFPSLQTAVRYLTSSTTEVARVTSPDGLVDAVVTSTDAGALVSLYYHVYIVPKGSKDLVKPILEGYGLDESKVHWAAPQVLIIPYTCALINEFSNAWIDPRINHGVNAYEVEIRLIAPNDAAPHLCS